MLLFFATSFGDLMMESLRSLYGSLKQPPLEYLTPIPYHDPPYCTRPEVAFTRGAKHKKPATPRIWKLSPPLTGISTLFCCSHPLFSDHRTSPLLMGKKPAVLFPPL